MDSSRDDKSRPASGSADQRKQPRFSVAKENYVSYAGGAGTIRDLGVGGVFVHDADPLPAGTDFEFDLHLGGEVIHLRGVVRHSNIRTGMGIEFLGLSPASKARLREAFREPVHQPASATRSPQTAPPPAAEPEVAPASSSAEASERLRAITAELRAMEAALLASNTDHRVLEEFRDAVDQVRLAAWSVQKWRELEAEKRDPYTLLPYLVNERIRRAAILSAEVTQDLDAEELTTEAQGLGELADAVHRLHERLSRQFKHLRKK